MALSRPTPSDGALGQAEATDQVGEGFGLAGEVRSIPQLERRMAECKRLGFTKIMCPADRKLKGGQVEGIQIIYVSSVAQAIGLLKPK